MLKPIYGISVEKSPYFAFLRLERYTQMCIFGELRTGGDGCAEEWARFMHIESFMTHKPLHDRVIVQVDAEDSEKTSKGGIILTQTSFSNPNPLMQATVMAVGDGEILFDGSIRKLAVKEGPIHVGAQ